MAHLDADVAAFVDGQLSPAATEAAARHVQRCDRCREAVAQQRHLKMRMQATSEVRPPASLLASLSDLPHGPVPDPPTLWSRVLRSTVWGATGVVVGASLAVVLAAYLAGAPGRGEVDAVVPPVQSYVADFHGVEPPTGLRRVSSTPQAMSEAYMDDLTANGWPCHGRLGADLERVEGRLQSEGAVSLVYTDGIRHLELHEQTGSLDTDGLHGFDRQRLADRDVWVGYTGAVRVVTWDADDVVFTVVTDVDDDRLLSALRDLPAPVPTPGLVGRFRTGMDRISDWVAP